MSARVYKWLLLIMALSQLSLISLMWKHSIVSKDSQKQEKRSLSDCNVDQSDVYGRFKENESNFSAEEIRDDVNQRSSSEKFTATDNSDRPVLLVAVLTARGYVSRRQAIRDTWFQYCDPSRNVICRFFTDAQDGRGDPIDNETLGKLQEEAMMNRGDLVLLNTPSGSNFAVRLLALFEWAGKNTGFDYLLRIDDDHYLCLERLLEELPFRPKTRLYWGYLHCQQGIVRIDEGMLILTADLVNEFLQNRDKLMCHKYGDQALAMWIYSSMKKKPVNWFGDARVHHDPPASFVYEFSKRDEICHTFLSLHGSYPLSMKEYQKIVDRERRNVGIEYKIPPVVDFCPYQRYYFDWNSFLSKHHARPVPCKDDPVWVSNTKEYKGRESNNFLNVEPTTPIQLVKIQRVDVRYLGNNEGNKSLNIN